MSKFELELTLTGFSLKIKGDREAVPQMAQQVGQQVAALIEPAAVMAGGGPVRIVPPPTAARASPALVAGEQNTDGARRRTRRRRPAAIASESALDPARAEVEWDHDVSRWGMPRQQWTALQKAQWLLFVVSEATGRRGLGAREIARVFNQRFYEAGQLVANNMSRDLGRAKEDREGRTVDDDKTQSPALWFLTQRGRTVAAALVAEAGGHGGATAAGATNGAMPMAGV